MSGWHGLKGLHNLQYYAYASIYSVQHSNTHWVTGFQEWRIGNGNFMTGYRDSITNGVDEREESG